MRPWKSSASQAGRLWCLVLVTAAAGSDSYDAFRRWLLERGASFGAPLDFGVDNVTGLRGLLATAPIEAGTELFAVPRSLLLTTDVAQAEGTTWAQCAARETANATGESFLGPTHDALALFLLEQRVAGAPWQPWVATLPASFAPDFPQLWSEPQLEELQASPLRRELEYSKGALESDHRHAAQAWPSLTFEEFIWARLAVKSRVFGLKSVSGGKLAEEVIAMVPLADFVNHPPDDNKRRRGNAMPSYDPDTGVFRFVATSKISLAEGVYWDYGFGSNRRSLLRYGFTSKARVALTDLPFFFKLTDFPEGQRVPVLTWKRSAVAEANRTGRLAIEEDGTVMHEVSLSLTNHGAERLLGHMRFMLFQPRDKEALGRYCPDTYCGPISLQNERQAIKHLASLLHDLSGKYETTIPDDHKLLEAIPAPDRGSPQWHALVIRYGEKQILRGLNNVVDALDPLFDLSPWVLETRIAERWQNKGGGINDYVQVNLTALLHAETMRWAKRRAKDSPAKSEAH